MAEFQEILRNTQKCIVRSMENLHFWALINTVYFSVFGPEKTPYLDIFRAA